MRDAMLELLLPAVLMSGMQVQLSLKSLSTNQGQRWYAVCRVAFYPSDIFDELASGQWSTRRTIRDLGRVLRVREQPVHHREALLSRINPILCHSRSFFFCLHFAVGCNNRRRTLRDLADSNSAESKSFLLNMCMLAPVSTTNSLSSSFITDGAGRHHWLVGEYNVALSVSLSLKIFLANLHASPRAHRSCLSISS